MNVWIINHYAMRMYEDLSGRHFWLSKILIENNHKPLLIGSSNNHFSKREFNIRGYNSNGGIDFFFLKGISYKSNGFWRVADMLLFSLKLLLKSKKIVLINKPDIIIASSPHLLSLLGASLLAKKFRVPLITEYRDLWPESMIAYGVIRSSSFVAKLLYRLERFLYKVSTYIVMTWEGGTDYLQNVHGFDESVTNKTYHISNGVSLNQFDKSINNYSDKKLMAISSERIVFTYTGSISKVNDLIVLVKAFELIASKGVNVELKIYGNGTQKVLINQYIQNNSISNVSYMGSIKKEEVPEVLKKSDINVLHNKSTRLDAYGQSQNKLFEYLAAGRPVFQTYKNNYSIVDRYSAGYLVEHQTVESIAEMIQFIVEDVKNHKRLGSNARSAAANYDYNKLFTKYIELIQNIEKN